MRESEESVEQRGGEGTENKRGEGKRRELRIPFCCKHSVIFLLNKLHYNMSARDFQREEDMHALAGSRTCSRWLQQKAKVHCQNNLSYRSVIGISQHPLGLVGSCVAGNQWLWQVDGTTFVLLVALRSIAFISVLLVVFSIFSVVLYVILVVVLAIVSPVIAGIVVLVVLHPALCSYFCRICNY